MSNYVISETAGCCSGAIFPDGSGYFFNSRSDTQSQCFIRVDGQRRTEVFCNVFGCKSGSFDDNVSHDFFAGFHSL